MANKQVFTESDIYAYKKALALHAAKNNALITKYEQLLKSANSYQDELYLQTPSQSRDVSFYSLSMMIRCYKMILKDLRKPCDTFIGEFEFQNVGKELV